MDNKEIELEKQQNRDGFMREIKYSVISQLRGEQYWAKWCEKYFYDKLKVDIQKTHSDANRYLEICEGATELYFQEKKHSDEQRLRARGNHVRMIDNLIVFYHAFMAALQKNFEKEQEKLVSEFFKDQLRFKQNSTESQFFFENQINGKGFLSIKRLEEADKRFQNLSENIITSSVVCRDRNEETCKKKNVELNVATEEVFKNFRKAWTEEKNEDYVYVLNKVQNEHKAILENRKRVLALKKSVAKLNQKLHLIDHKTINALANLKRKKSTALRIYCKLKETNRLVYNDCQIKLKFLRWLGKCAKQKLLKTLKKAQSILNLSKICDERTVLDGKAISECQVNRESFVSSEFSYLYFLQNLQMKIAREQINNLALGEMTSSLRKENAKLIKELKIKEHLEATSKNLELLKNDKTKPVPFPNFGTVTSNCQCSCAKMKF